MQLVGLVWFSCTRTTVYVNHGYSELDDILNMIKHDFSCYVRMLCNCMISYVLVVAKSIGLLKVDELNVSRTKLVSESSELIAAT